MIQKYLFGLMYLRTCSILLKGVEPYRSLKSYLSWCPRKCTVLVPLKMRVTPYITNEKYYPLFQKIWISTCVRNCINALEVLHSSLDSYKESRALCIFRKYPPITVSKLRLYHCSKFIPINFTTIFWSCILSMNWMWEAVSRAGPGK